MRRRASALTASVWAMMGVVGGRAVVQTSISWIGMIVRIKWSALQQTHGYEYLVRFALGGVATLLAGVIADRFGPETGGLFLAFPAILCASATLVEKHERDRKTRQGLKGAERGRSAAALDATGAGWGSLALATFAIAIWRLAPYGALPALGLASMLWPLVARSKATCAMSRPVLTPAIRSFRVASAGSATPFSMATCR
jgi:hypothetical protein